MSRIFFEEGRNFPYTSNNLITVKTLNICDIKISRFNENDILAHFNFDIPWLQIVKKISCKLVTVFLTFFFTIDCGI